jgi:hypothetical protein
MYEGDPYNPASEPSESEYDSATIVSELNHDKRNRRNSALDAYRAMDKGYYKTKRLIEGKLKTVEFFSTPTTPGASIRDAIHGGLFIKSKVGSGDEDLFFKTRMTTVEPNVTGDSITLYFDNPEQCERHLGLAIGQNAKEAWKNKNHIARFGKAI